MEYYYNAWDLISQNISSRPLPIIEESVAFHRNVMILADSAVAHPLLYDSVTKMTCHERLKVRWSFLQL